SIPVSTPFITLWTHGQVPRDMPLLLCLLAAIFLAAPGQASMSLLRYSHHPRPIGVASLAYSCGGLLLCFILVPQIGVIGAAIAFMITESLAIGIYQPIVVGSLFGFGAVRHILGSYAAGLCTFVPSFAIATALFTAPGTGLIGIFLRVALWAAVATPIAALLAMTSA